MNFKAIFDGAEVPDAAAPDVPPVTSGQSNTIDPPHLSEEETENNRQRNRNSRIYAEASEQMLGMGDRELDSKRHAS